MAITVIEIPADINWESLPGLVTEETKIRFRVMVEGTAIMVDDPAMMMNLIRLLQTERPCRAREIADRIEVERIRQETRGLPDHLK